MFRSEAAMTNDGHLDRIVVVTAGPDTFHSRVPYARCSKVRRGMSRLTTRSADAEAVLTSFAAGSPKPKWPTCSGKGFLGQ